MKRITKNNIVFRIVAILVIVMIMPLIATAASPKSNRNTKKVASKASSSSVVLGKTKGIWISEDDDYVYVFNANGTGTYGAVGDLGNGEMAFIANMPFTWKTKPNKRIEIRRDGFSYDILMINSTSFRDLAPHAQNAIHRFSSKIKLQMPAEEPESESSDQSVESKLDKSFEYRDLDQKPEFPGGMNGLAQFLGNNIKYPSECIKKGIQGKVLVKFTIFTNGQVGNVNVVQSVHPLLDAEAVRVISLLPKWQPGKLDGEPVNVYHILPITFKL